MDGVLGTSSPAKHGRGRKCHLVRPSTVEGANEGANTLFDTVDALFGTVDREGVGNEEGANLLLLPPLWSA